MKTNPSAVYCPVPSGGGRGIVPEDHSTHHAAGLWECSIYKDPNWKSSQQDAKGQQKPLWMIVVIKYEGRKLWESHGRPAYLAAKEQIVRWHQQGHIPKPGKVRCMADLGVGGRIAAGLRQECKHIKAEHVGAAFLEGLK